MFGWSKKKDSKRRGRPERSEEENEFGIKLDKGPSDKQLEAELKALTGVDSFPDDDIAGGGGEEDEEAELLRLMGGGKGKRPPKKPANPGEALGDITIDVTADIEDVGDEDVEVDENDEELLGELLELIEPDDGPMDEPEEDSEPEDSAPPPAGGESDVMSILKERLKLYKQAEAKAKENNESSRARRFSRGIKTLEDLIKKAKAGKPVSPNDIPPVIALNLKPAPPVQPEMATGEMTNGDSELLGGGGEESEDVPAQPNAPEEPVDVLATLMERLKLYQTAEMKAKESGETTRARRFNRGIKTIEGLIRQARSGKPVSPADIPPAVALNLKPAPPVEVQPEENEEEVEHEVENVDLSPADEAKEEEPVEEEQDIMKVLSERLKMYQTAEAKAKETGESTRARRFGRGIKTIQDLIRQAKSGKQIPPDEIPPAIALNLKPAPPVVRNEEEETEPREAAVESDNLVRSPNVQPPLKFTAVDDIDLDEELNDEEIPQTVLEGLEQRLRIYTNLKEKAEEEGDEESAEQNARFVRVYINAIRTYKNGGYIDVLKLPAPKGCPPIPIPFQIP